MNFGKAIQYNIRIEPTVNDGFIVEVGCVRLVYTDKKDLVADLEAYLDNPERLEKEYYNLDGSCQPEAEESPQCLGVRLSQAMV